MPRLSTILNVIANVAKLREDPVLRKQFEEHVKTKGKAFALTWLDNHAAEAGLNPAAIDAIKNEINKPR